MTKLITGFKAHLAAFQRVLAARRIDQIWTKAHNRCKAKRQSLAGAYAGSTIVCAGNGPSLATMDVEHLCRFPLILTNHAYLRFRKRDRPNVIATIVTDDARAEQVRDCLPAWARPLILGTNLIIDDPKRSRKLIDCSDQIIKPRFIYQRSYGLRYPQLDMSLGFSDDAERGFYSGISVIFSAIQLAAYLGASRVVCVGIDFDYSNPKQMYFVNGIEPIIPSFHYDLARPMMRYVAQQCSNRGIELINATPGGAVDELVRVSLADLVDETISQNAA